MKAILFDSVIASNHQNAVKCWEAIYLSADQYTFVSPHNQGIGNTMDTTDLAAKVRIPKLQPQEVAAWSVLDGIERSAFVLL